MHITLEALVQSLSLFPGRFPST